MKKIKKLGIIGKTFRPINNEEAKALLYRIVFNNKAFKIKVKL